MSHLPTIIKERVRGVTFIELLVVIAIIGVLIFPLFVTYQTARNNQALRVSAEDFASVLTQAHIHARDARDKKGWGVKRISPQEYALVAGEKENNTIDRGIYLDHSVTFESDFYIWFTKGTGETDTPAIIYLISENGQKMQVDVLKSGAIEVTKL